MSQLQELKKYLWRAGRPYVFITQTDEETGKKVVRQTPVILYDDRGFPIEPNKYVQLLRIEEKREKKGQNRFI